MRLKLTMGSKAMGLRSRQRRSELGGRGTGLMLLEDLDFLFVLLGFFEIREGAEVPPLSRRLIFLA